MSFLYPRVISISRPVAPVGVGALGYSGETKANETVIATGIPASIQQKSGRSYTNEADLPANATIQLGWRIYIPLTALAKGTILNRDVVTDDEGNRYTVHANYWNSLGYNLLVALEQV